MSLLFEAMILLINSHFFFFVFWGISCDFVLNLLNSKEEVLVVVFEFVKFLLFFGDFILVIFLFSQKLKFILSLLVVLLVNTFNEPDLFLIKRTFIFLLLSDLVERSSGSLLCRLELGILFGHQLILDNGRI